MNPGAAATSEDKTKLTWRFPRVYWFANGVELLERAAFYAMFISLTVYLTRIVGFSDVGAGWVAGVFAAMIYFAPPFTGALADTIGFRKALTLAFSLLMAGYAAMWLFQTKPTTVAALACVAVGGSFVKSIITGTVAKCSDDANRARAFSLFYLMVNIGAFSGKTFAKPIRTGLGLEYINLVSAALCLFAVLVVAAFYRNTDTAGTGRSLGEVWRGFVKVLKNVRFMALIVIVGGFWAIQHQMYATMPKYVLRMVGEHAAPEWYANVNPFVVVLFVVPITQLVRRISPVASIGIALLIIPFSSLLVSLSPYLTAAYGRSIPIVAGLAAHPVTVMMVVGIALQGFAECFLSPRFLEYASLQAPPGETALYMGYSHLTSFFANILGFGISGYLLEWWCPDPLKLPQADHQAWEAAIRGAGAMPAQYADAHYIWYVFAGIGFAAFAAIQVFRVATSRHRT